MQEDAPAALALAGGLVVQHRFIVARCQRHRREGAVLAETIVIEAQRSFLNVEHHAADLLANRPENALVTSLAREPDTHAKVPVGDQRHNEAAMDGLATWLEGARPWRLTLWGTITQLLQHSAVVEGIHHVEPGCLVKGLD